ncbi:MULTISPECIES: Ig-like domain-containing protein [Lactobacillaceae]|uniref:Ig-like domain-containing protein n=1 Tax=Lactobacillaceae TaxID=33958 RepID=UPI0014579432|nr:Ig-like domain-containing protein [Lactobacillus sp. HBUAS51381]NLR10641.1 hypothetical protein [Lactobacillus sp. HBUAS51381]
MVVGRMARLLSTLLAILVMVGIYFQIDQPRNVARAATVQTMQTPSPAPVGALGLYLNTGFNLQPADSYTFVGHKKILTTSVVRSVAESLIIWPPAKIQWFQQSDDMISATKIDGATSADLTVTPQKQGTVYYQQQYHYLGWIKPQDRYSRIAKLTTSPDPVAAESLAVRTDNGYLYNNQKDAQQTYVHATPTPVDATGDLTWSSSDPSLATVSKTTGEVTANNSGKAGIVKITGTMTNPDGKASVSAETSITIGGGLDSQTVDEGQPATFKILGKLDQTPDQVVWHRVDSAGKDTVVSDQTAITYTVPPTTLKDNQNQYYANIKVKSEDKEKEITTNRARLNVKLSTAPNVSIVNTIDNLSNYFALSSPASTGSVNFRSGEECQVVGTISDRNMASKLSKGDFTITLPQGVSEVAIKVDDQAVSYDVKSNDTDNTYSVSGQSLRDKKPHIVEATFTLSNLAKGRYATGFKLSGYDDQSPSQSVGTFSGNEVTMNLTDGKIDATANNVDFGRLTSDNLGQELSGKVVGGGELLDVTDNREHKSETHVALRQVTPLRNGQRDLDAEMSFNPGNGEKLKTLSTKDQDVLTTKEGESLPSIGSAQGQGLMLKVTAGDVQPGTYTTQLIWSIVTGP